MKCTVVTAADVKRISGLRPAHLVPLAHAPGSDFYCGTLFVDGSGQLILEVMEGPGDPTSLARVRRTVMGDQGDATPVPSIGPGAFVSHRELAFLRRGRLVTLQTGYSGQGKLQLSAPDLIALAKLAAERS